MQSRPRNGSGEAGVSVSIVNWCKGCSPGERRLWLAGGTVPRLVAEIPASLSVATDVRTARPLRMNTKPKVVFEGQHPGHRAFVLSLDEARRLVARDSRSAQVIYPYLIGREVIGGGVPERFIIDLLPPSGQELLLTPRHLSRRVFGKHLCDLTSLSEIRPDSAITTFALADDYSFGVLQSSAHIAWFRERCSHLESRPRYTSRSVFESFPWPQAPTQDAVDRVVDVVA